MRQQICSFVPKNKKKVVLRSIVCIVANSVVIFLFTGDVLGLISCAQSRVRRFVRRSLQSKRQPSSKKTFGPRRIVNNIILFQWCSSVLDADKNELKEFSNMLTRFIPTLFANIDLQLDDHTTQVLDIVRRTNSR